MSETPILTSSWLVWKSSDLSQVRIRVTKDSTAQAQLDQWTKLTLEVFLGDPSSRCTEI